MIINSKYYLLDQVTLDKHIIGRNQFSFINLDLKIMIEAPNLDERPYLKSSFTS